MSAGDWIIVALIVVAVASKVWIAVDDYRRFMDEIKREEATDD